LRLEAKLQERLAALEFEDASRLRDAIKARQADQAAAPLLMCISISNT